MASGPDIEADLDELYAGAPDDFVKQRNALAKRVGKEGHKDAAAAVRALRKPTRAAALVNELSRDNAKQIETLVKAGEKLRDAGTVADQKKLRAAVASERKAVQALLDAAQKKAAAAGASSATLERVGETLRAVVSDPELAEMVRAGRLDAEREASTIGFELALSPPTTEKGKSKAKVSKKAAQAAAKQEKAKLARLIGELESAERLEREAKDRVVLAKGQLERARAAAKEATKKAKQAEGEVTKHRRKIA
jgi:hypothetical protein